MGRLVFLLLLLVTAAPASGATIIVADCEYANVSAAYTLAGDGDTIQIPSGSCTWNSTLVGTDKFVRIRGAGIDVTTITGDIGTGFEQSIFQLGKTSGGSVFQTKCFVLSDMTLADSGANVANAISIKGITTCAVIARVKFLNVSTRNVNVLGALGVIYDSVFSDTAVTAAGATQVMGQRVGTEVTGSGCVAIPLSCTGGNYWWNLPAMLGTDAFFFMEGNTYTYPNRTNSGAGCFDGQNGARVVFRYNDVERCEFLTHGNETLNEARGMRAWEVYNNTFTNAGAAFTDAIGGLRAGTGVVHDNTIAAGYSSASLRMLNYRTAANCTGVSSGAPFGNVRCDGTSTFDSNVGTGAGAGYV